MVWRSLGEIHKPMRGFADAYSRRAVVGVGFCFCGGGTRGRPRRGRGLRDGAGVGSPTRKSRSFPRERRRVQAALSHLFGTGHPFCDCFDRNKKSRRSDCLGAGDCQAKGHTVAAL